MSTAYADSSAIVKLYALPEGITFLAFDKTLRAAATAEGFQILPA